MPKPNRNDINIGEDKWITFIELQGRQSNPIDADKILDPIKPFLDRLETECVAACCGIDAYGLWPDDIARATRDFGDPGLPDRIAAVRNRIAEAGGDVFVSHRMNNYFDKQVLLQLLDHIACCVVYGRGVDEQPDADEPRIGSRAADGRARGAI
jgi:hypothetical protein